MAAHQSVLFEILNGARRRGFLGPGSLRQAVEHARGFAAGLATPPRRLIDLGSGGGLPGLVLACEWTESLVSLLESSTRRCHFLREAVTMLDEGDRIEVVEGRAEEVGRRPELRGAYDLVTSRGFGPPAVTAECAAPFLEVGGHLVVSEPPVHGVDSGGMRWPEEALRMLGLGPGESWETPFHYRSLLQLTPCPERFPRRVGVPAKRPLF